jgi:D-3-phosphoglycerate dehydrogenase / 2-oxoglutarate reductase
MRVVAIDAPGYGPWHREERAMRELGGDFAVLSYDEFCARTPECDALVNGGGWPLAASQLDRLGPCGLIVGFGTGVDWIDIDDANARGIVVARTPHANVEDVATHSLALILACARRVMEGDAQVRLGEFDLTMYRPIHRLHGRRLALLSFGNIPRRLRVLVEPFGVEVRSYDPLVPRNVMRAHGVEPSGLDELLGWADILSVHTPATETTMGLIGERELRLLRPGAIVVITSRGGVYDAHAVARLLEGGHIASAGLDVFPEEPLPPDHPLLCAPRTVLTPHSAGYSEGALEDYHAAAIAALTTFFAGGTPEWVVTRDQPRAAVGRGGG